MNCKVVPPQSLQNLYSLVEFAFYSMHVGILLLCCSTIDWTRGGKPHQNHRIG